jgi:UDP-GlcNAc:undecaprenyl-phosphate/decaprenyl-phosphate GlcNAc-1-phosphate transferase
MYVLTAALTILLSAGLTVLLVPIARRLAVRAGLVVNPGAHRGHERPTPLGGGVAMLLAILLPCLLVLASARIWAASAKPGEPAGPAWLPASVSIHIPGMAHRANTALVLLAGAAALCVLGLIDDRRPLGPWSKLIGQAAIALAVVVLADLRVLTAAGEPLSTIVSALWIIAIVNSINFMDNADGLAAGVTLICATSLLAAAAGIGQLFVAGWLCLLIGATAGFLLYNFPPASIFMGDAGSMVLGYFLAVLSMLTTYYDPAHSSSKVYGVLAPLVLLAVPLYDTASVMLIRLREGRSLMIGDRRHFSHRLRQRGMSSRQVALTVYLCTAVTAGAAVMLPHVPDWAAWLIAGQTLGVLGIIALLESTESGT